MRNGAATEEARKRQGSRYGPSQHLKMGCHSGLKQGSEIQLQGPNGRQKCGVSKVSEESEREMRA